MTSSVIRQKGKSQDGGNRKAKHAKFSVKKPRTFLPHLIQWVRNVHFFRKIGVLCFVVTSVLRFTFLPYYWQLVWPISSQFSHLLNPCMARKSMKLCCLFVFLSVSVSQLGPLSVRLLAFIAFLEINTLGFSDFFHVARNFHFWKVGAHFLRAIRFCSYLGNSLPKYWQNPIFKN